MRLSVVIPSRDESVGLWATVTSVKQDLESCDIEHEIVVVENSKVPPIVAANMMYSGIARVLYPGASFQSPQAARQHGFEHSTGETVFFLDAHCVVPSRFFRSVLEDMEQTGADLMHTPYRYVAWARYEEHVDWNGYLWSKKFETKPASDSKPYPIALASHGGFAVRRKSFSEVGGYWQFLRGFGGEEPELNLKMWLLGKSCWMTPRTFHWHYVAPEARRTPAEMYTARDFARNFLAINYVFGGDERMHIAYDALVRHHWKNRPMHEELLFEVPLYPEVRRQRKAIFERAKYKTLSELRAAMDAQHVSN